MNVTVAQLLKHKKRIAGRIATVTADITKNNSKIANAEQEVDVLDLVQKRKRLVDHLVQIKTILYEVNKKIQWHIFKMAELKSEIAMYQGLNTLHGETAPEYGEKKGRTYIAIIRKGAVDKKVEELTLEIDAIQEHLDGFNHNTKVDVPDFAE